MWDTWVDVSIRFQSLRSSSSGNCLVLSCDDASILIDCGIKTQRECRAILAEQANRPTAVLVSHAHGDHICYASIRVLEEHGLVVHCHDEVLPHVYRKHVKRPCRHESIRSFGPSSFSIGCFEILPIELPHEPSCPTFGFVIGCGGRKLVVCTDFYSPFAIAPHLCDADFVFIESNHDLELLRQYPNYASHYHMSNEKTAAVLSHARQKRDRPFGAVMLGHLSEQRNDSALAIDTVRQQFEDDGIALDFNLHVAPRYEASDVIHIN